MEIDLRTMVIVLGITQFLQVLAFYHQLKVNKTYAGIGWWFLWSMAELIGIGFILLRDIPSIFPVVIIVQNSVIVAGTVFLYIGVRRFFNLQANKKLLVPVISFYLAGLLFFSFILNDVQIRSGIINFTLALFSFFTAYNLFVYRSRNVTASAHFIGALFLVNGGVFVYRTIMIFTGTPLNNIFAPTVFNLLPYFDVLIVNLLSTFGFVLMLNQRLKAEMMEATEDLLLIFNTSPDAALISRLDDGKILEFNDGFISVTGYNREEISGKSTIELNIWKNPDDRDIVINLLKSKGYCENFETHLIRKDGKEITGLVSAKIINLKGVPNMLSITRDITGRKQHEADSRSLLELSERSRKDLLSILEDQMQMQEALKDSSKKWQTTFDGIRDSIFLLDLNGIILQTNKISQNILGKKEEQIIGRHCHELVHNRNCFLEGCPFVRMKQSKQRETMILPSGDMWFEILVDPILDDENNLTGAVHFICDITERKLAERDLEILSSRNKAMLEAIPDIIMEVDNNMVYTWANHAGFEFFGNDVIGKEAAYYFEGDQQTYQIIRPIFDGKEDVIYVESWQRRHDGEKRLLGWWCRVLKDLNGNARGALSSARDITEINLAEKEILRLNTELEQRVLERTAQLESVNKELEAFSYSVSHDLRAPLRHISGYVDLLNERFHDSLPDKGQHYLDSIADSAHQMGVLIDDLLQFSRSGRKEIRQTEVDMNNILEEVLKTIKQDTTNRNIEWINAPLPHVFGDYNLLHLVWINLLSNAVKFTRTKEKARIETGFLDKKKEFVFFVRDNGAGFDMQYADKLYGVFQRLHSSQDFEGTGIGLANVRRIILKHGGSTWAEAEVDKGATFYFTLPKHLNRSQKKEVSNLTI